MDCSEFQTIVSGEREEDLSRAESDAFESHLESCASCREAVSRAEDDLERLAHVADPPLVAASAWSRIDEVIRAEARKAPGREDPFAPLAEAAVAVAEKAPVPVAPAMPVTLEVRRGGAVTPLRSRPLLAVAAMAAALLVAILFFASSPRENPMRVKPPEEGDVVIKGEDKTGESFKKIQNQKFIQLDEK